VLGDSGFSCRWHSSGSGIALFLPRLLLFKDDDSYSPSPWMDALRSGLLAVSCHVAEAPVCACCIQILVLCDWLQIDP